MTLHRRTLEMLTRLLHGGLTLVVGTAFVAAAVVTVIGESLRDVALDRTMYLRLVSQLQSNRSFRGLVARALITNSSPITQAGIVSLDFPADAWETLAESLIPPTWMADNATKVVEALLDWVGQADAVLPDLEIDLTPIIDRLLSREGPLSILPMIANAPACPPGTNEIVLMGEQLLSCLPMGQDLSVLALQLATLAADALPERISLNDLRGLGILGPSTDDALIYARAGIQVLDREVVMSSWLSIALLLLHITLQGSSVAALRQSLRLPLVSAGGITLAIGGIGLVFVHPGLDYLVFRIAPGLEPPVRELLVGSVGEATRALSASIVMNSLPMFAGGVVLWASMTIARWRQQKAPVLAVSRPRRRWREFR
jgi:hypothetical protein